MKNRKKALIGILALFLAAGFLPAQGTIGKGNPDIYRYYKGLEGFGVTDAWRLGITGKGVKVAVIDDGIDFGSPDLVGAQARVENPASPYNGWPIVIDLQAIRDYQQAKKPNGMTGYMDTSSTDTKGFKVTGTSKSGVYHIGNHTDRMLTEYHGERVKILVVDENKSGVYDTVYVDLNVNHDFTDDKPCRRGDEIAIWDRDGDGLSDETGGIVYFIADGPCSVSFTERKPLCRRMANSSPFTISPAATARCVPGPLRPGGGLFGALLQKRRLSRFSGGPEPRWNFAS